MSNGGSAFPIPEVGEHKNSAVPVSHTGMSLRDYFAAAALTGRLAKPAPNAALGSGHVTNLQNAQHAYALADAMIMARGNS